MFNAAQPGNTLNFVSAHTDEQWHLFSPAATSEEFYRRMTAGLPEGTQLSLKLEADGGMKEIAYDFKNAEVSLSFKGVFNGNSVFHVRSDVEPQGTGIAKTISAHLYGLYREKGIKKISIKAAEIGVYAWARIGFVPDHFDWNGMKEHIGRRFAFLKDNDAVPKAYADIVQSSLESSDPKKYWDIVDQKHLCGGVPLGKLLTLDFLDLPENTPLEKADMDLWPAYEWDGAVDFNDPQCIERYEANLRDNKPSAQKNAKPAVANPRILKF